MKATTILSLGPWTLKRVQPKPDPILGRSSPSPAALRFLLYINRACEVFLLKILAARFGTPAMRGSICKESSRYLVCLA